MAYDASYGWEYAGPKRWRRWAARALALVALAASGFGVWTIVRDATDGSAPPPQTIGAELRQVAASAEELATGLAALRPRRTAGRARARAALREAAADRRSAVAELERRRALGEVQAEVLVANALTAYGEYLRTVGQVLRNPRSRTAADLRPRARRVRAAFGALPDPSAVPEAIRGWRRLAAYARAARG